MIITPRIPLALLLALTTTGILFLLMKSLIATDAVQIERIDSIIIDLVKPLEMNPLVLPTPQLSPPPQPETPPLPPKPALRADGPGLFQPTEIGPVVIPGDVAFGISDGEYLPLVRIQPSYPRSALARGIEGYVVVEFDISANGFVLDPRIIDAYPGDIFNRAALTAIMKFKYKPAIQDGVARQVNGARNRFSFKIAGS
jgi:protein TonB